MQLDNMEDTRPIIKGVAGRDTSCSYWRCHKRIKTMQTAYSLSYYGGLCCSKKCCRKHNSEPVPK